MRIALGVQHGPGFVVEQNAPFSKAIRNGKLFLGGGFKYFLCLFLFGEDSHFDEHIFQMGFSLILDGHESVSLVGFTCRLSLKSKKSRSRHR